MITLQEISGTIGSKRRYWIAFVGDSITSCEWVHPNWREIVEYVLKSKLDADWGFKTFNFGYDGASSRDILERTKEIEEINPDLVILMIGGNDPFLDVSINEHIKNINNLTKIFKNLVISTNNCPWNTISQEKYLPYVEADIKEGFKNFINLFEISRNFPNQRIYTFISEEIPEENIKEGDLDYWHPNQLGNAYIAKVILKEVFGVDFDPELYIKTTLSGEKYPKY